MDSEIRDPAEARRFLAQGLWLQRVSRPSASTVASALRWSTELASGGEPIPPVGFVADLGNIALSGFHDLTRVGVFPEVPGWPAGLVRAYEDNVLGRLDADALMARASGALARYRGRDRSKGLAFLLGSIRRQAGFPGALLNPAAIKAAHEVPADILLAEGWETLARDGPMPVLLDLYARLIDAVREMPEALAPEDIFEIESRTALMDFADRVAIRQVIRASTDFEAGLTLERPRPSSRRLDVATEILDEDTYPVGGYSSISTRGSMESLLYSQLAYMEPVERPDLFDIKYARDELLYYARDENQFFRRRHAYQVVFYPDLVLARVKDGTMPYQQIVLVLGLLVGAVRQLTRWLGDDSIVFEVLFLRAGDAEPLAKERALLEMALKDRINDGSVVIDLIAESEVPSRRALIGRGARSRVLHLTSGEAHVEPGTSPVSVLQVGGDRPVLLSGRDRADTGITEEVPTTWNTTFDRLLTLWTTDPSD